MQTKVNGLRLSAVRTRKPPRWPMRWFLPGLPSLVRSSKACHWSKRWEVSFGIQSSISQT